MTSLILIGLPASGKSTIAPLLARRLGWDWKDTDGCLEVWWQINHGSFVSSRELYRTIGEQAFRELEHKALAQLKIAGSTVLAIGGGTVLNRATALHLKNLGKMVYLRQSVATTKTRVSTSAAFSIASLEVRLPVYEEFADITIEADALTPEEIVNLIMEAYGQQ